MPYSDEQRLKDDREVEVVMDVIDTLAHKILGTLGRRLASELRAIFPDATHADFGAEEWENGYFYNGPDRVKVAGKYISVYDLPDHEKLDELDLGSDLATITYLLGHVGPGSSLTLDLVSGEMEG